jgi:pyrroline-5-carboxylate reductase
MSAPSFDGSITLSPRNGEIAAQLSAEFPSVVVGASNQDVLDRSDLILITLRPQKADEIIAGLSFRPDHPIISAVAALSRERLLELVAPARTVVKAIPLPTVAQRRGVTALYPGEPSANELFDLLGSALPVADEFQFSAMSTATSVVASYAMLAQTTASWLCAHGVESLAARNYVNALLAGIVDAAEHSTESFAEIADTHATRGGLNEQLRLLLEAKGVFSSLSDGLDRVMARVTGRSEYAPAAQSGSAAD